MWNVNYSNAYFDLKATGMPGKEPGTVNWRIQSKLKWEKCIIEAVVDQKDSLKGKTEIIIPVNESKTIEAWQVMDKSKGKSLVQSFHFNKATGKTIRLIQPASSKYPGDGDFTLINGIQNEKGLSQSSEFLGFEGRDCAALIDFGTETTVNTVTVHSLESKGSWIWYPTIVSIRTTSDGMYFNDVPVIVQREGDKIICSFQQSVNTRMLLVAVKNQGPIPDGNPGAGNNAWLFVDEIEAQ